jgi:MFS family permease
MFSPITLLCGLFTLIVFGWLLINDVLLPTFLQDPVEQGGYGFTPVQNAACQCIFAYIACVSANHFIVSFAGWVAILVAQLIGMVVNDGLPLWICKRYYNGIWRPELRLYAMTITVVFCPVGLGICGVALQHHYHYIVFAVGYFVTAFSVLICVPVATNYIAESFKHYAAECTLVMTFYRLSWGVAIPFFISRWIDEVGVNWVYGTAALITIVAYSFICVLLWKGPVLRTKNLIKGLASSEEGEILFAT